MNEARATMPAPSSHRWAVLILFLLVLAFVAGVFELFELRYAAGDVYPPYSSLRADPLGTMILYESLGRMPRLSVWRDVAASNHLPEGRALTYLHLAATREDWEELPQDLARELDAFLVRGGRLIVAFKPELTPPLTRFPSAGPGRPVRKPRRGMPVEEEGGPAPIALKDKWGIEMGYLRLPPGQEEEFGPAMVRCQAQLPVPPALAWHSGMIFTNLDPAWETIYARGTNPVMVQRAVGPGTVVLASDSYFVSNEAMVRARHADLLRWLVGPARAVVFDEAHLGVVESPGVASMMRRYRLHGVAAGLLLLAALFIWKNSLSFVPAQPEPLAQQMVEGKDAGAGFINLLRRNIAPADVLQVCFAEWTKSLGRGSGIALARVDQAQAVLETETTRAKAERDPVRAYQEICRALKPTPGVKQD
ncbi:MAG TPA: DUF4350 domain-containing protein [Verrucomicrobiae bacterium]|nr:DUF4350 domain-containing protein [Verrucomicrobiae bacterium]